MIQDDTIEVIVQKLEMLLFTRTGELFGDIGFGADLEYYLWQTQVPANDLRNLISKQISYYIPELETIGYQMFINIYEGKVQDILVLDFIIKGYNLEFIIN
jgi:hypothetical protein